MPETGSAATGKKRSFYEYAPLFPIGIDEINQGTISIYPNPITEHSILELNGIEEAKSFQIWDLAGRIHTESIIQSNSMPLKKSDFVSGTYVIVILDENNEILKTDKLIVI